MKACSTCPNRWLADLFEAMGSEDKAKEIREAGCHWWQIVPVKEGQGYVEACVAANLERFLRAYGGDILLASDTVQADRTEQKKALDAVQESARAMGFPDITSQLAALGLRAALGAELTERKRLREAEPEDRRQLTEGEPSE